MLCLAVEVQVKVKGLCCLNWPLFDELGRSNAKVVFELACEMLWVVEAKLFGNFRNLHATDEELLGTLHDEPPNHVRGGIARQLADEIAEVIGRQEQLLGTIANGGQTVSSLQTFTVVAHEQILEACKQVGMVFGRRRELLFEGKRYYDLVRRARREGSTTYVSGLLSSKFTQNASAMRIKMAMIEFLYMPFAEDELKRNPLLKQNPAYDKEKKNERNY